MRWPWTEAWGRPQVSLRAPHLGSVHPLPRGEGLSSQHLGSDPQASLSPHPRLVWPLGGAGISEVPQTRILGPQVPQ